ncbi:hypothetical protein [Pseudomonas putida]
MKRNGRRKRARENIERMIARINRLEAQGQSGSRAGAVYKLLQSLSSPFTAMLGVFNRTPERR